MRTVRGGPDRPEGVVEAPAPPAGRAADAQPAGAAGGARAHRRATREIAKGSAVTLVGVTLHFVLQYGLWLVVSHGWGASGLGLFATAVSVLMIGGGIVRLGLAQGVLRYVAALRGVGRDGDVRPLLGRLFRLTAVSSAAGGALLFVGAGALARLFDKPDLVPVLRPLALGFLLWNVLNLAVFAIQGLKRMGWMVAVRDLAQPLTGALAVGAVALAGLSLGAGMAAYVASMLVSLGLAAFALARLTPRAAAVPSPPPVREVLAYSLPLVLNQLLHQGIRQQEIFLLAYFLPAAQVGLYGAALKTAAAVTFILQATNAIFAPLLAELHGRGDLELMRRLYRTVARWCYTLGLPFFLAFVVFGSPLLSLWGAEFAAAWPVLVVLGIGYLANVSTSAAGTLLVMGDRQNVELGNSVLALVLGLALDVLLIPRMGVMGAAVAAGASMTAVNVLRVIQVRRYWAATPFGWEDLKPTLVGAVAGTLVWLAHRHLAPAAGLDPRTSLAVGVPLLGVLYATGLWAAGFEHEDRELLAATLRRLRGGRRRAGGSGAPAA
jgi:O-antigen/teichoic acid export membrane protein